VKVVRVLCERDQIQRQRFWKPFSAAGKGSLVFVNGKSLSIFSTGKEGLRFVWAPTHQQPRKLKGRLVVTLSFYAAVANGHRSKLYFVPPSPPPKSGLKTSGTNFTSKDFVSVMKGMKKEFGSWFACSKYTIIRDKPRQHTSKEATKALAQLGLPILESYPAQSWDINCIEHVWAQLVRLVGGHRSTTPDGYRAVVIDCWRKIAQPTIDLLVDKVPERIKRIAINDGRWIDDYKDLF
jgi:hypothetical protein